MGSENDTHSTIEETPQQSSTSTEIPETQEVVKAETQPVHGEEGSEASDSESESESEPEPEHEPESKPRPEPELEPEPEHEPEQPEPETEADSESKPHAKVPESEDEPMQVEGKTDKTTDASKEHEVHKSEADVPTSQPEDNDSSTTQASSSSSGTKQETEIVTAPIHAVASPLSSIGSPASEASVASPATHNLFSGSNLSIELQQEVHSFALFYGNISNQPSLQERRILNGYDLVVLDFDNVQCSLLEHRQTGVTLARVNLLQSSRKADSASGKATRIDFKRAVQYVGDLKARKIEGLHGVYVSDFEEATKLYGVAAVMKRLRPFLKENKGWFIFTNGTTAFGESEYLQAHTHGLVLDHPTMNSEGEYNILPNPVLTKAIEASKIQMQRRPDFIVLAHECVPQGLLKGAQVTRFVKFCQSFKLIPTLCIDTTHSRAEQVQPVNPSPLGPLAVLAGRHVSDFLSAYKASQHNEGKTSLDKAALVLEIQSLAQRLGHDLKSNILQSAIEKLQAQYADNRESVYMIWVGLASIAFQEMANRCEQTGITKLAEMYGEVSRLFKVASQCEELCARHSEETPDGATQPTDNFVGATVKYETLDKMAVDGDVAEGSSGQREFGFMYRKNEYNRVVEIQERLRKKNLLKNMSKKTLKEVCTEGSDEVKKLEVHEQKFMEMLEIIDHIIYQTNPSDVYGAFANTQMMMHMKQLRTALETVVSPTEQYCGVQLWEADPQSVRFTSLAGDRRFFAVWKRIDDTALPKILHIYINRLHPNIAEAVVHSYFESRGYAHTACVLLETLCRRIAANPSSLTNTDMWRKFSTLPERFIFQLLRSSYSDLGRYVLQTQKVSLRIQNSQLPEKQKVLALKIAEQVKAVAKYMLLEEVRQRATRQQKSREMLGISDTQDANETRATPSENPSIEGLREQFEDLFQTASWQEGALAVMDNVLRIITHGVNLTTHRENTVVPAIMYKVLTETGRRNALDELEMQVRDSNAYLLREADLVTVYLEFNGLTEADSQRLFEMSKFHLGQVLYARIRDKMEQENPAVEKFDAPPGSYDEKLENVLSIKAWMTNWANGLFFMVFMAINMVVVLLTGIGAYTSTRMPRDHSQAIALGMISAFISAGSINACISRLGSMYQFQWGFSLAMMVLIRLIASGFIIGVCVVVVAGIPMLLLMETFKAAVFLAFYLLFLLMLIMMGALLTIKRGSVWTSAAGMWVLAAQAIEITIVFVLFYVPPESSNPFVGQYGAVVHLVGLLVCVLVMAVAFFILAHEQTTYLSRVIPTKDDDVYTWYAEYRGVVKPPSPNANDEALTKWFLQLYPAAAGELGPEKAKAITRAAKQEAQKAWADARKTFSSAVAAQKAKLFPKRGSAHPLIKQRAVNYPDEEMLMKWYILLTSKTRPEPCSKDWDALLGEGKEASSIKFKTDSFLRGGLLWDIISPDLLRGTFYYALLFCDRIVQMMYTGTGTPGWFLPTSRYELAAGWALVALLLSVSCLEAIPYRLLSVDLGKPIRFDPKNGEASDLAMIRTRRRALRSFYALDKLKVLVVYILCAGACGAILWWYSQTRPIVQQLPALLSIAQDPTSSILLIYGTFVIGFLGFVLGTYNSLFLADCMGYVGMALAVSTITGIVAGYIFVVVLVNSDASATAMIVAGWLYYFLTLVKFLVNSYRIARPSKIADSKFSALQSSAMMTSGQRWVGSDLAEEQEANPQLVQHLLDTRCVVLTPNTDTGAEVAGLVQKALTRWTALPENALLRAAFPEAGEMFHSLMRSWHAEKIVLSVVEEGDLKLAEDEGFSAFSVSTKSGADTEPVLQVFVGLNEDSSVRRVAEALIHEYAEQFMAFPHRRAVLTELLLSTDVNMEVPSRVTRQLSTASRKRLIRLADGTDDTILRLVAGTTTMEKWESLSNEARVAVVAALELPVYALLSPTGTYVPTFSLSGSSVLEQGVADLQADKYWPVCSPTEHIASVILLSQLAISIKREALELCASRMNSYTDQQQTIPINVPAVPVTRRVAATDDLRNRLAIDKPGHHSGGIKQRIDAFLRLGFLAFTADDTFSQEWAYIHTHPAKGEDGFGMISRVLSMPLLLVNNISRGLISGLTWTILLKRRPDLAVLYKQLSEGVYGNEIRNPQGLLLRMQYNAPGARPRTGFVTHHETLLAGGAVPEGQHASVMNLYPQLIENEPEEKRGREATVMYLPDGRVDRIVDYAGTGVKSVAIYNHIAGTDLPETKFAYRTTSDGIGSAPRSEVMRCPPLYVIHYDNIGRPSRVTFHHEFRGHKVPISATYRYADNEPISEPLEIDYNRVPDVNGIGFHDYYKLTVRYHQFTSRVKYVDSKKEDGTGSSLRTFFIYRNLKHCNQVTFKLNEKGELGRAPMRFLNPAVIKDDTFKLVSGVPMQSVMLELMVAYQTRRKPSWHARWLGKLNNKKRELRIGEQYPTLRARVMLWKNWNKGKLEGVFTGMWDEAILRKESDLTGYWAKRDWGKGAAAAEELASIQTTVTAKIQPDASHPELRTHKLIKIADMIALVPGGYCNEMLVAQSDNKIITDLGDAPALDVVGLDSGTWPADGGGVASCRRDLVDRLRSVVWTQMAEVGTPMKLTMYQIEQNVRSLTLIPLWGDILGDPCASIYTATPYSTLAARKWRTTPQIIEVYFVPLLRQLVDACALVPTITDNLLEEHTSMIVNLYTYFQEYDWLTTWTHPIVTAEWRSRWCKSLAPGQTVPFTKSKLLASEYPTVTDLDMLLSLFGHFLFPITVPLPPHPVYHASHHGVQTILGVVAQRLYGSSLIIWDHGMLWREKTKAIAELWQFSPFVRNGLLGLSRLTLHVNYYNATTITSCCTRGNPDWELWLGGRGGCEHDPARAAMYWRMSPVVNGMETDKFMPKHAQEAPEPTVVQLSHVYDLKDIKTAIRAAAIIVNVFKLTTYRLLVFGSTTKDVDYASECKELIASEGLSSNVFLMGLADATKVLAQGWLFLNSSQSEGLPLALGEAGLSGLPVVCTDVGGSREVVTDGETVLGSVVPPRNPMAVARAEVEVLAMLTSDQLAEYEPIAANADRLLARMKDAIPLRRRLGNKFRAFVMENFGMERYLREHEQQIWLGAMRCDEIRMEAVAISKGLSVRHAPTKAIRHFHLEVAPKITEVRDGEATTADALFDLYADMSFRMIDIYTAMHKNTFLQQFSTRNNGSAYRVPYKQNKPANKPPSGNGEPSVVLSPKQKLKNMLSPKLPNPFTRKDSLAGSPSQAGPSKSFTRILTSPFSISRKNLGSPHTKPAPPAPVELLSPPLPASPPPVPSAPVLQLSSSIPPPTQTEDNKEPSNSTNALPSIAEESSDDPVVVEAAPSTPDTNTTAPEPPAKPLPTPEAVDSPATQPPDTDTDTNNIAPEPPTKPLPTPEAADSPAMRASPSLATTEDRTAVPTLALSQTLTPAQQVESDETDD